MFINSSFRTDIAARYSEWFMNRIREGYVLVRNPYYFNKVSKYQLTPDVVDCLIFCTKNPKPMLQYLSELKERGFSVYFFVTITGYGKDIEPSVPEYHEVMESFCELSDIVSTNNVGWRYDPILVTSGYTTEYHLECFDEMADALAGYTDYCIFSFVQKYKKLEYTFPELRTVTKQEKEVLLKGMSEIAEGSGLKLQTCGDCADYSRYGIQQSGCITAQLMEHAIGKPLKALKAHPNREGCGCLHSVDIGSYDTCPNGCRYCYANKNQVVAVSKYRQHDPKSPFLIGNALPTDIVSKSKQVSFLL